MPTVSYGVFKSHVGYSPEASFGSTGSASSTAVVYIPCLSYDDWVDDQGLVMDEGGRAKAAKLYNTYPGVQQGRVSYTHPFYPNSCFRFFVRTLGNDLTPTSSQGGWQHQIIMSDLPGSDTIYDFFGSTNGDRAFSGGQCESLVFKFDKASGMATIKPTFKTAAPTTGPGTETTVAYTSDFALRGYESVFSVAASTRVTLLTFEATITRDVELIFAGNNSQRPASVEVGNLDIAFRMSMYGSTDQPYFDYRANTHQSVDLVINDPSTLNGSSGGSKFELLMSNAVFTKVTPDRSGKYLRFDVEGRGIYNVTDSGPFQVITTVSTSSQFT